MRPFVATRKWVQYESRDVTLEEIGAFWLTLSIPERNGIGSQSLMELRRVGVVDIFEKLDPELEVAN